MNPVAVLLVCLIPAGCGAQTAGEGSRGAIIDTEQMIAHVRELSDDAYEGRKTGTPGAVRARAYITQVLAGTGASMCSGSTSWEHAVSTERAAEGPVVNVIAEVPGTVHSDLRMVVSAHYDHLGRRQGQIYNGADDNASGTAAVLELARYFAANPPEHTIVFALFDFEEGGLNGSRAFVDEPCGQGRIAVNVNLDMVSRSLDSTLFAAGTYHYGFLRPILESVPVPEGMYVVYGHDIPGTGSSDWTMSSDHGPFHAAGIPFVYYGVEDHGGYHHPSDDFAFITQEFYAHVGNYVADVVSTLNASLPTLQ